MAGLANTLSIPPLDCPQFLQDGLFGFRNTEIVSPSNRSPKPKVGEFWGRRRGIRSPSKISGALALALEVSCPTGGSSSGYGIALRCDLHHIRRTSKPRTAVRGVAESREDWNGHACLISAFTDVIGRFNAVEQSLYLPEIRCCTFPVTSP
jgi:hypothetical protein